MPAAMIANTAPSKFPLMANRIAVIPAHNASRVRTLGTRRLTDRSESRRTRTRGRRTLVRRAFKAASVQCSLRETLAGGLLRLTIGEYGFTPHHPLSRDHH